MHRCHTSTSALRPLYDALCERFDLRQMTSEADFVGIRTKIGACSRDFEGFGEPDRMLVLQCQAPEHDDDLACDQLILLTPELKVEIHRHRPVSSDDADLTNLIDLIRIGIGI